MEFKLVCTTWPRTPKFPQLACLASLYYCKSSKTVLPNSTEAGASGGKTARDVLCRLISLLTLFHLDSFMDRLPKFLSPRQSNLKPQWELDGVALFVFVSRRAWGSRHFFFPPWKGNVIDHSCVLAGLLAMSPEKAELVGAAALQGQSSSEIPADRVVNSTISLLCETCSSQPEIAARLRANT